jgi:catechol 2,3-dioxygenase-like lactoylglutathione lyase family enzyme
MTAASILRVARPSDNLEALLPFYRDGLGLRVLGQFRDHDGFDGIVVGNEHSPYHFEFTRSHTHRAGKAPTADNLLVFYLPDPAEWHDRLDRMRNAGFSPVPSFNPFWDRNGVTFEDPDGYRVAFQRGTWAL